MSLKIDCVLLMLKVWYRIGNLIITKWSNFNANLKPLMVLIFPRNNVVRGAVNFKRILTKLHMNTHNLNAFSNSCEQHNVICRNFHKMVVKCIS